MKAHSFRSIAEFRGPGVHHSSEESGDDFEMGNDKQIRHRIGRIIMLGDANDVSTEAAETPDVEIFDQSEEDKDLESQVDKGQARLDDEEEGETEQKITPGASPREQKAKYPNSTLVKSAEEAKKDEDEQPGTSKRRALEHLGSSSVPEKLFTPPRSESGDKEASVVATPSKRPTTDTGVKSGTGTDMEDK